MHKGYIIAIDGPVASGKGTIANHLARRLKGFDLYTGATYRCLALFCIENKVDLFNKEAIQAAMLHVIIEIKDGKIFLNGNDVTERIKKEDVASKSSIVAAIAGVRKFMVYRQQEIAQKAMQEGKIVIAEGRDTGTVVFPTAELKLYLTAT